MGKKELLEQLTSKVLKTPRIIEALKTIDRKDFVTPETPEAEIYEDKPLSIGFDATISQPHTVAFMLELLDPRPGQNILDVGSGSGSTTALLAHIVGKRGRVIGVEIVPELVGLGRENLAKYDLPQARIQRATSVVGAPEHGPYDRILVSAAAEKTIPQGLVLQMKVGGRMVIPIKNSVWQVDRTSEKETDKKEFPGFAFLPLKE